VANLIFWIAAVVAVAMALGVVTAKKPMHAVVALVVVFVMLGTLFLLLHAEFLAIVEVLIYAGAVVVLFLFVVALLLTGTGVPQGRRDTLAGQVPWAIILGAAVLSLAVLGVAIGTTLGPAAHVTSGFGGIAAFATALFTTYLLPFELTAVVLLVAVIGVVFLARERR